MPEGRMRYACTSAGSVSWKGDHRPASVAGRERWERNSVSSLAEPRRCSTYVRVGSQNFEPKLDAICNVFALRRGKLSQHLTFSMNQREETRSTVFQM